MRATVASPTPVPSNSLAVWSLEWLEELARAGHVEAAAVVPDVVRCFAVGGDSRPELDDGRIAFRGVFPGIAQQVFHRGAQQAGVADHGRGWQDAHLHEAGRVAQPQVAHHLLRQGAQVNGAEGQLARLTRERCRRSVMSWAMRCVAPWTCWMYP